MRRTNVCGRGLESISLRPKAFAVLKHLVERPGQLVTKQQLLEAVWPETFVSDAVLKDSVRQLREALGDDAAAPRYIETAHRRGYRFIAQISAAAGEGAAAGDACSSRQSCRRSRQATVNSDIEKWCSGPRDRARQAASLGRSGPRGERQVVFVTGEPGIGKTTIVNAMLQDAAAAPRACGWRAASAWSSTAPEKRTCPYWKACLDWAVRPAESASPNILRSHAPAWLLQLPSLISSGRPRDAGAAGRGRHA